MTFHVVTLAVQASIRIRLKKLPSMAQGKVGEQKGYAGQNGEKNNIFLKETTINELCKPEPRLPSLSRPQAFDNKTVAQSPIKKSAFLPPGSGARR